MNQPVLRIYLIRHGESQSQTGEAAPDDLDPPLSRRGRRQAARLKPVVRRIAADRIVVSCMRRAWQTFQLSGATAPEIACDSRLIESDWGIPRYYAGLTTTTPPVPDRHRAWLQPVRRRSRALLADLLAGPPGTVVLFGHWGVFGHLFQDFFRLRPGANFALNAMDNTAVSLFEVDADGRRSLRYWNERVHLGPAHAKPFW